MVSRPDPWFAAMKAAEESEHPPRGRELPKLENCPHLWAARLPGDLDPGAHVIHVRAVDMFGQEHTARRIIRVQ